MSLHTTINESFEKLQKDLDDKKKVLKIISRSYTDAEDYFNWYCEEFVDPGFVDPRDDTYKKYKFLLNHLIDIKNRKNIVQEELKNIEEKYNKALIISINQQITDIRNKIEYHENLMETALRND
jgi:hypothetical protein